MDELNDDLMEAVASSEKKKVIEIITECRSNSNFLGDLNLNEALRISIAKQDVDIIKLLLRFGADAKYTDNNGSKPLHLAVLTLNIQVVKLILGQGCSINVTNNEGKTPLHIAVECGNMDIVDLLIFYGASINRAQTFQMCEFPIHIAAKKGYIRIIDTLRSKGANLELRAVHGRTPLHYAILNKQFCTVEHLCLLGVDIDAKDIYEDTALALAFRQGTPAMVEMLINYGARVDIPLSNGITVLHYIPSLMIKQPEPNSYLDMYNAVMKEGQTCVNHESENGTPLHAAVNARSARAVEFFLDWGADVNAETNGYTALLLAASSNQEEVVRLLLAKGAHLHGPNQSNVTPSYDGTALHSLLMAQGLSARRSKIHVLQLLVSAGCRLNARDRRGFTALDRHLYSTVPNTGRAEVAELVQAGAVLTEDISHTYQPSGIILRMRREGFRARSSSSIFLCTWQGDLLTAVYLLDTGAVPASALRAQAWLTLPGRNVDCENFLIHCREVAQCPDTLVRLCRAALRQWVLGQSGDRDVRPLLLAGLTTVLPRALLNYLLLRGETEAYLS